MSYTFLEDIPEFLENQRTSFLRILDTGLIKALEKINPIAPTSNCNYGLLFYPKDYVLVLPDSTTTEAFLQGKTYGCKIYVPTIIYEQPSRVSNLTGKFSKTPKKSILKNLKDDFSEEKNAHSREFSFGSFGRQQRRSTIFGRATYPFLGQVAPQSLCGEVKTPMPMNVVGWTNITDKNSKRNVCHPMKGSAFGRGYKFTSSAKSGAKPLKKIKNKKWINETQNTNFANQSKVFKPTFKNYNACYSCLVKLSKHKFLLKSKQRHCSFYNQDFSEKTKYVKNSNLVCRNALVQGKNGCYIVGNAANTVASPNTILSERGLVWTKEPHVFFKSISEQMQIFKPNLRFLLKHVGNVKISTEFSSLPVSKVLPLHNRYRSSFPVLSKGQKCLEKSLIHPPKALLTTNTENYPFTIKQIAKLSLGCYYTLSHKFVKKYNSRWPQFGSLESQSPPSRSLPLAVTPTSFLSGTQRVCSEVTGSSKNICGQPKTYVNSLLKKRVSRKEWVCIGVLPLMTPRGHFIINGSHRIVVSQMSRAPGLYYETSDKLEATIVPSKGAWLRISLKISENGEIKTWVRITPQRKMPYKVFFETYKYLEVLKTQRSLGKMSKKSKVASSGRSRSTIKKTKSATQLADVFASGGVPAITFSRQALGLANQLQGRKSLITKQHGLLRGSPHLPTISQPSTGLAEGLEVNNVGATVDSASIQPEGRKARKRVLNFSYKQARQGPCIARQTQFLSLIYKSVNNKIKQFDKHYAVGLISGQINRTLLNVTSFTLGSLGRKKLNERLGTNETTGYITSKDIYLIKNKLLKLLNQGSTAVDDDIDHLENRRVRTCGELLQTEIDVGLMRLKKAIEKHLDTVLTQNAITMSKGTSSGINTPKQFSHSSKILSESSLRNSSGFQLLASQQGEAPKLYFNYNNKTVGAKASYLPSRVGVDLALIGVNQGHSRFASKLGYQPIQHNFWTRLTGMAQSKQGFTFGWSKSKGFSQYNNTAPHKILYRRPEKNQDKNSYVSKTLKTQLIDISPSKIVGTKVFAGALREFFGSNPLSQYMDQTNPLAEMTHKRRLSSLGPGGIDRASAGIAVRGIHPSHYGRICPIETPEGKNAGLVNSMTIWARINREGFLEAPYLKVTRGSIMSHNQLIPQWQFIPTKTESNGLNNTVNLLSSSAGVDNWITEKTTNSILTSPLSNAGKSEAGRNIRQLKVSANTALVPCSLDNPKPIKIVAADLKISASSFLPDIPLPTRDGSERSFGRNKRDAINFFGVSPTQNISVATSLIPFLEHDDATRALMGSNMQRQAVPLVKPQSPLVRTGLEGKVVGESGHALQAICSGVVSKATRTFIAIDVFRSQETPRVLNSTNNSCLNKDGAQILTSMGFQGSNWSSFRRRKTELWASQTYNLELVKGKHQLLYQILFSHKNTTPLLPFAETIKKNAVCGSLWKTGFVSGPTGPIGSVYGKMSWFRSKTSKSLKITRQRQIHSLQPYIRSNQATICVQRPAVSEGYWVQKGDLVADCSASRNGVLALGQNIVVAYLPMEGFNFEDAIVVSDRLVQEELYTSIHVQRVEFDMDAYVKKYLPPKIKIKKHKSAFKTLQQDWITRQNPHLLKSEKQKLNSLGIIKVGSWVGPGDVLVSKVFPVERKIAPSRHLLLAVLQEKKTKTIDTDDTSLRVPKGIHGRVINVKIVGNGTIRPVVVRRTATPDNKHLLQNLSTKTNDKIQKNLLRHSKHKSPLQDPGVNFAPDRTRILAQTYSSSFRPCGQKPHKFSFVQKRPVDRATNFPRRQSTNGYLRQTSFLSEGSTSPPTMRATVGSEARPCLVKPYKGTVSLPMARLQNQYDRGCNLQSPVGPLCRCVKLPQEKHVQEKTKSSDGSSGFILRRKLVLKTNEQKTWALGWLKGLNFLKMFTYFRLSEGISFGCRSWFPAIGPQGFFFAQNRSLPDSSNLSSLTKGSTRSLYRRFGYTIRGFYLLGVIGKSCTTVGRTPVYSGPKAPWTLSLRSKPGGQISLKRQAGFSVDGFIVVRSEANLQINSNQERYEVIRPAVSPYLSFEKTTPVDFLDHDLCVGAAFTLLVKRPTYSVAHKLIRGIGVARNVLTNTSKSSAALLLRKSDCFSFLPVLRKNRTEEGEKKLVRSFEGSFPLFLSTALFAVANKSRQNRSSTYSLHNFVYCPATETVDSKSIRSLKYNLQKVHLPANNKPRLSDVYRSSFELFNQPDHLTGSLYRGISGSSVSETNSTFIDGKQNQNYEHQYTFQGAYVTATGSSKKRELSSNIFSQNKWVEKPNLVGEYKVVQVRVYIAERKKLQVGDKMSGRHGNKGIVSTILPREDMPFLPDGTSIDMVLNPLGIPSRMNVGQVFECLLGLAASICGEMIGHTPFDEMYGPEASRSLVYLFLYVARLRTRADWLFQPNFPGKTVLFDGRTGIPFEQRVTVGRAYMLKLVHMVDEKIHARSIGPRSLVTQQPIKGRARGGGQRLGEMELWAFEGFGAAYTLQEILTLKSDDIKGREEVESSIISARSVVSHLPETFKMMLFELKSLCLNVELNQNF